MINFFLDSQFLQSKHTANTEQNLLLQTILPVATIERVSDGTIVVGVHLVIGIKQIKLDTTYINLPNVGILW
jgi:hypothetical protein